MTARPSRRTVIAGSAAILALPLAPAGVATFDPEVEAEFARLIARSSKRDDMMPKHHRLDAADQRRAASVMKIETDADRNEQAERLAWAVTLERIADGHDPDVECARFRRFRELPLDTKKAML